MATDPPIALLVSTAISTTSRVFNSPIVPKAVASALALLASAETIVASLSVDLFPKARTGYQDKGKSANATKDGKG